MTLNVARSVGSTGPVSVQYSTVNGTAVAGTDFGACSGILNWLDGDTAPKPITIPLLGPSIIGPSKQLTVSLSNPQYGTPANPATASVTFNESPYQAWIYSKLGAVANASPAFPPVIQTVTEW